MALKVEAEREGLQFDKETDGEFVLKFPDHFLQLDKGVKVAWRKTNEPANFLVRPPLLEAANEKVIMSPSKVFHQALASSP